MAARLSGRAPRRGGANRSWCSTASVVDSIRLSKDQGVDAEDVTARRFLPSNRPLHAIGGRIPGARFASPASKFLFAAHALATTPSKREYFAPWPRRKVAPASVANISTNRAC